MLILSHTNIKSLLKPSFFRAAALSFACALLYSSGANSAENFDTGESTATPATASGGSGTGFASPAAQSAGSGFAPTTGQTARSNVSFKDFGTFNTPNNANTQYTGENPSDLLPINQQNTVDNMQVYSRSAQDTYSVNSSNKLVQSGSSYTQSPQLDPSQVGRETNPFLAGNNPTNTSLPPTTTAVGLSPYNFTSLPGADTGKHAKRENKTHFTFGFEPQLPAIYNGSYDHLTNLGPAPVGSGFRLPASLPSTSLGSCLEINQDVDPWTGK